MREYLFGATTKFRPTSMSDKGRRHLQIGSKDLLNDSNHCENALFRSPVRNRSITFHSIGFSIPAMHRA